MTKSCIVGKYIFSYPINSASQNNKNADSCFRMGEFTVSKIFLKLVT